MAAASSPDPFPRADVDRTHDATTIGDGDAGPSTVTSDDTAHTRTAGGVEWFDWHAPYGDPGSERAEGSHWSRDTSGARCPSGHQARSAW
jgi:hypothetical protein